MLAFSASREGFCQMIAEASQGLSSRPQNPVHAGMLLATSGTGKLYCTASDGDVTFSSSCDAAITGSESIILPGGILREMSRFLPGDIVELECTATTAVITCGKSRFTLSSIPGEDYPSWPSPPEALGKLPAEDFISAVKIVSAAAKKDHPIQRGMRLAIKDDHLQMTCTDGSRMAYASLPLARTLLTPGDPVLAPAAVLERFSRVAEGEVSAGWEGNLLGLSCDDLEMSAPQVSGEFPKTWTMILKDHEPVMTVNVPELSQMIKMAAVTVGDKGAVTLEFSDKAAGYLSAGSPGYLGVLETKGSLEPRILDFTPQYLLDGLHGEEVSLSWTGRALMIEGDGYRYLCQPRRKLTLGT